MKTLYKKNNTQFNFRVNEEEYTMVELLREKYSINISGAFKNFLKDLLKKMQDKEKSL